MVLESSDYLVRNGAVRVRCLTIKTGQKTITASKGLDGLRLHRAQPRWVYLNHSGYSIVILTVTTNYWADV